MVDDGLCHRAHDAVRHERRPGDLEEGPSGRRRHVAKSSMAVRAAGRRAAEASGEMGAVRAAGRPGAEASGEMAAVRAAGRPGAEASGEMAGGRAGGRPGAEASGEMVEMLECPSP